MKTLQFFSFIGTMFLISFNLHSQETFSNLKVEVLQEAEKWTANWNGKIDKAKMMAQYHPDMQYYWRGQPMSYKVFENVLENDIIPNVDYQIILSNPIVSIMDQNNAVVSFNFSDVDDGDEPPSAASLTITKVDGSWKVINVHESMVKPYPPNDFEEQFNTISKKFQDDYMNARCDELLPMLDVNLVIFENGEHWPYAKVKEFCPHLPVKPVISTDRSYKILDDDLVYEFVSQMYKSKTGNTVNETQAMIWKYADGKWKIINYDISRYAIKTDN